MTTTSVPIPARHTFQRNGDTWTETAKLSASDAEEFDLFGNSAAISGDYIIVGARGGSISGSAYLFQRSGNDWTEVAKLTASDAAVGDFFSSSVALDGDFAVVGASHDDGVGADSGSTYLYHHRDGNWVEVNKLLASDATAGDRFGSSVAISGDYALIGARDDDDGGSSSGSAHMFLK